MSRKLINFAAFQIGWFACVLGAANNFPWVGPVVVLSVVALHLALSARSANELVLLLFATAAGVVFDSMLTNTGWLAYPNGVLWPGTAPYWIVAMWPLFATTLNVSLRWLHRRPILAVLLGATGGPLSYLAGSRLGGLVFIDQTSALIYLAIGWGIITPALVYLAERLDCQAPTDQMVSQHA